MKASEEFVVGKHSIGYVESYFTGEFGNDEINPGSVLTSHKLPRRMTDSEIIKEFSIEECTMGDVMAFLDNATAEQKDGYSNIFYIAGHSHVVGVDWDDGRWNVYTWRRDGDEWVGGGRVFSPATDAKTFSPSPSESGILESLIARVEKLEEWRKKVVG